MLMGHKYSCSELFAKLSANYTKTKDLKSPLTKKWNPVFHLPIRQRLAKQSKQKKQLIRNISNGLTMPDIANAY